jgi:hypothetical protein
MKRVNPIHFPTDSSNPATDRRASDRFPMERDVRFKVINRKTGEETGVGKTINMSSNGVLIHTEQNLLPGRRVELTISWPAQLNNTCPLKLVARGRIARVENGRAAIEIQQYEFRTQGKAAVQ